MKVKVKTIWGSGLVSVSEPYVKKALEKNEGLEIDLNGKIMKVSHEDLLKKSPRGANFTDKYGRKKAYSLYDFFWSVKDGE